MIFYPCVNGRPMTTVQPYPAIYDDVPIRSVLATLIAGGEPPRVKALRVHSDFLDRPPYPQGRLFLPNAKSARRPGHPPTDAHIWYCCARYGRAVPVAEYADSVNVGTPTHLRCAIRYVLVLGQPTVESQRHR